LKIQVPRLLAQLLKDDVKTADDDVSDTDEHAPTDMALGADSVEAKTVALQGGGVLIFDEYGRLKYQVSNSVLDAKRQSKRLRDLAHFGFFRPQRGGGALMASGPSFATLHRLRSLDMTRMTGEGW
jgi:hypothetical protein